MAVEHLGSGVTVSFGESGQGVPLLLVHGSPGEGGSWRRVTKQLPASLRAITLDRPGYGASPPIAVTREQRSAKVGAIVAELAGRLGGPAVLCGHSYGGNVALHAALAKPDAFSSVILLEPVLMRALTLAGDHETYAEAQSFFSDYVFSVRSGKPQAVGDMIDYWFGAGAFAALPPPVQTYLDGTAARGADDVEATFAEAFTRDDLATLHMPVTVAYGVASPPVAPRAAHALGTLLPRARVRPIADATHGMLDSHPADLARIIAEAAIATGQLAPSPRP